MSRPSAPLVVRNHRGVPLPRTLGLLIGAGGLASTLAFAASGDVPSVGWASAGACAVVLAVGVLDDLAPAGPRGLRNHLRALLAGRITTGVLKATVIPLAALVVAAATPGSLGRIAATVVLLAGGANLANALDLRPGRALKAALPPLAAGALLGPVAAAPVLPGLALAALPALVLDLRERAMLGDGGANLLGFAAGLAVLPLLGDGWLAAAAAVVAALNLLAEARSLSAIIESTPALRALDRLGRLPGSPPTPG